MSDQDAEGKKLHNLEQNVIELQKEMVGVKHIMENQGQVLVEIKNVLIAQTKTLDEVFRLKDKVYFLNRDFEELEGNFKKHEDRCHTKDRTDEGFKGRIKGGLTVALFLFSLVQITFGYYISQKDDHIKTAVAKIDENTKSLSQIKTDIEVLKKERGD